MNVTTHIVAPHTYLKQHDELTRALDALFREYHVPPAILQHSFVDRRPGVHYTEILNLLTPFPTHPSSELLEDIGRAVAPAQTRFVGLQSSYYPPVFPPAPAVAYAPNEDQFVLKRSQLVCNPSVANNHHEFENKFESKLILDRGEASEIYATLTGSFTTKTNPDKPGTTLTITSPSLVLNASLSSNRHVYTLHSLSASARRDPHSPAPYTLTPHFNGPRDQRFERTCNGLRYECTWNWAVLDDQMRVDGSGTNNPGEYIVVDIPPYPLSGSGSGPRPLSIYFTATLAATAGLDAISRVHRTAWARPALEDLQHAFDSAHPAVQIVHHVVRVDIPDVGEMIAAGMGIGGDISQRREVAEENGVYACGGGSWVGGLRVRLDQDAGVLGRRGDEDEEENSDEDSASE